MLGNLSSITKGLNSGAGLQYDAGTLEQQQQQNEINGQLQKWMYENNASLNDLLAYKQLISGDMGDGYLVGWIRWWRWGAGSWAVSLRSSWVEDGSQWDGMIGAQLGGSAWVKLMAIDIKAPLVEQLF